MTGSSAQLDTLLAALKGQSRSCHNLGSPFTALVCEALAEGLSRLAGLQLDDRRAAKALMERLRTWPGDPSSAHDSVPLRLAGGLHALVRRGAAPSLAALYPPNVLPALDVLAETSGATLLDHASFFDEWLNSAPQTNEVGRSAVLGAGMIALEKAMPGLNWRVLELGASGGLNLIADHYALHLSGHVFGGSGATAAGGSGVALKPDWRGKPLNRGASLPGIVRRLGCDLNPLDLSDRDVRERLLAYIWADQTNRLARTQSAIQMANAASVALHRMGAEAFLRQQLAGQTGPTLVMHSVAWQYFPAHVKAACRASLSEAARMATPQAPLAWLGMEADGTRGSAGLRLKTWPDPGEASASRLLARVDYHGRWIDWLDADDFQSMDPGAS